jgi:hypothetical protein
VAPHVDLLAGLDVAVEYLALDGGAVQSEDDGFLLGRDLLEGVRVAGLDECAELGDRT